MAENWKKVARDLGFSSEREMWETLYVKEANSIEALHDRLGYGTHTIKRRLAAVGIDCRSRGGNNGATPPARDVLFHLDQRVVHSVTIKELTWLTGCSPAVISNYKNTTLGGE